MKNKGGKIKYIKLGSKFTLICVLPAVLLLIALCIVSVNITINTSCTTLRMSMIGQAECKVKDGTANIAYEIERVNFKQHAKEISKIVDTYENDITKRNQLIQKKYDKIEEMLNYFSDVQIFIFEDKLVFNENGMGVSEYDEHFNESCLEEAEPHFTTKKYVYDQDASEHEAHLFTYVEPIVAEDGTVIGELMLGIKNQYILKIFPLATNFTHQSWMVVSKENDVLYHSEGAEATLIMEREKIVFNDDLNQKISDVNGVGHVINVYEMDFFQGAKLVYVVPFDEIMKVYNVVVCQVIIIAMISIVLIVICIRVFTAKIVNDINGIRKSMSNIGEGNFNELLKIKSNDELGLLIGDINDIIKKLKYQAEHDMKTEYFNSSTFALKVKKSIENQDENMHSIIRVDIDNFSFINDIYDWSVGDQILIKVANMLKESFDENSVFGYFGNDIFVVYTSYAKREDLIERIQEAAEKIKHCDNRLQIVPHFGVCDVKRKDMDIRIACDYAGVALKTVKGNLLTTYAIYDDNFDQKHKIQKFVESHKQIALDKGDYYVMLQPKCDIYTGEILGAEALVRWRNSETGEIISPGKFIPIFEKNGFIVTLDRYVWEEVCKILKRWNEKGYRKIPISVNVSRVNVFHAGLVDYLDMLVKKYEIDPGRLEIEITESALLEDSENILYDVMVKLKQKGFKILMDDFASGYSSLIALQTLPFDLIKIDKALIDRIDLPENHKFVKGVVAFLNDFDKEIVIEGVEHEWQREELKSTGSKIVQGYCFSKPLSVDDFEKRAYGESVNI